LADRLGTGFVSSLGDSDECWRIKADLWKYNRVMIGGSDAGAHLDMLDTFDCYVSFLAACRDRSIMPIHEAIAMITGVPARFYRLPCRGVLAPGNWADILLIDESRIACGAVEPRSDLPGGGWRLYGEASGIETVLVNGISSFEEGGPTGSLSGHVLRSGAS
jgi:N-acyl-D-aspartate/D-glutamate deacylase